MSNTIKDFFEQPETRKEIDRAIPAWQKGRVEVDYIIRNAITAIISTPKVYKIAKGKPALVMSSLLKAVSQGVVPSGDQFAQCWFTVKSNSIDLMMSAKGYEKRFFDLGGKQLRVIEVRERDEIEITQGTEKPMIKHRIEPGERGETIGWYAVAVNQGGTTFEYRTHKELMEHQKSFAPSSPVWRDKRFLKAMCRKTMVLIICRAVSYSLNIGENHPVSLTDSFQNMVGTAEYQSVEEAPSLDNDFPGEETTEFESKSDELTQKINGEAEKNGKLNSSSSQSGVDSSKGTKSKARTSSKKSKGDESPQILQDLHDEGLLI